MTLGQLQDFKRWHVAHRRDHPLELWLCDLVLTAWLVGWLAVPLMPVLDLWHLAPVALAALLSPELYCALRRRLHRSGLLRCDWLCAVATRRPR